MYYCTSRRRTLVAMLSLVMLSACVMYSPEQPGHRVSKLELGLNIEAIADPTLRSTVEAAKPDIVRTLRVLSNQRLSRDEAASELGWSSTQPLELAPEWRSILPYVGQNGIKRAPMAFMKAEAWTAPDTSTVAFTALFSDGLKPELTVRERQTYRRDGRRWKLVKQER